MSKSKMESQMTTLAFTHAGHTHQCMQPSHTSTQQTGSSLSPEHPSGRALAVQSVYLYTPLSCQSKCGFGFSSEQADRVETKSCC